MNTPQTLMKKVCLPMYGMLAALLLSTGGPVVQADTITEPATVFYGKVIGTGSAQPFILHEGALAWTLQKADGTAIVLRTELYNLNNGTYSYRLDIPHSVLADETVPGDAIPLPPMPQTNLFVTVTLDGEPAMFAGPSGASFAAAQATRAATYRLDLEIGRVPADGDGDGMPDWWEERFGLDPEDPLDAGFDPDGDGLTNLQDYLRGLDPTRDSRLPVLATTSLLVFPECTTGLRLTVNDTDSAPENLHYTLTGIPESGHLVLRNREQQPEPVDQALVVGDGFTQQAVLEGRLVFAAAGTDLDDTQFTVTLRDETAEHPEHTGTVELSWFTPTRDLMPATVSELRRRRAQAVGLAGNAVVWDEADTFAPVQLRAPSSGLSDAAYTSVYQPAYGPERTQVMTGGRRDDQLDGGMADDLLVGGQGVDLLAGHGGADIFLFDEADLGLDTISDFDPAEGDVVDLRGLLAGAQGWVRDYLTFEPSGQDTRLGIDLSGQGSNFTDLVVTLSATDLDGEAAYDAVRTGAIEVGSLRLQPRMSVAVTDAEASENGANAGVFTLKREGDLGDAVTVLLALGGSAENGVDYASQAEQVVMAAGQAEASIQIRPFADSSVEPQETVELVILEGAGYRVGVKDRAELLIRDLQAVVGVEVLEALGSLDPAIPGVMLVTRNGQTADSLLVKIRVAGSAANGYDYSYLPPYVIFQPGQTAIPVDVALLPQAMLTGGAETVDLTVVDDAAYALADTAEARVVLVSHRDRFDTWMTREFPEVTGDPDIFAASDPGKTGFSALERYAYGMDPHNPAAARLPQLSLEQGHCLLWVFRNPGATDIRLEVERSTDLLTWTVADDQFEKLSMTEADVEVFRGIEPATTQPKAFLRIRIKTKTP